MIKENIKIALNSSKEVFVFQSSKGNKLSYKTYDSNLNLLEQKVLYDENIICYDLYIDEKDVLHLVSLVSSGEMIYYKLIDNKWSSGIIGKFDLISNIYKQIEILVIKNKLHIIYNLSNLINSNVWTIQHVIYDNKITERHNITRYISTKNPEHFVIDVDSTGIIHLVYNPNINKPQIFHSFYNPYSNKWSTKANKVSDEDKINLFPYIFIDTKDNIHMLWLEFHKDKYNIKYFKKNAEGKDKFIWRPIELSRISISKYPPIIFEQDNMLKLIFSSESLIKPLRSNNYGDSWSEEEEESCNINQYTIIAKTKSNIDYTINKTNYFYCEIEDDFKLYFFDIFESPSIIEEQSELKQEKVLIEGEKNNINFEMHSKLNKKLDSIIENQNSIEELVAKILKYQEYMDIKLDDIYEFTESDKKNFFERLFNSSK